MNNIQYLEKAPSHCWKLTSHWNRCQNWRSQVSWHQLACLCCQPRTPAKLRSAVSRKICWLKKMCVICKIIWFIMGSIRSSAEWLTREQEQSKHCHMSRAREKSVERQKAASLCVSGVGVRKHSTQVTSCRIRNTGTLAWKLSYQPASCGYDLTKLKQGSRFLMTCLISLPHPTENNSYLCDPL